jgi:hypothetical protein
MKTTVFSDLRRLRAEEAKLVGSIRAELAPLGWDIEPTDGRALAKRRALPSNAKPKRCETCRKKFGSQGALNLHVYRAHARKRKK